MDIVSFFKGSASCALFHNTNDEIKHGKNKFNSYRKTTFLYLLFCIGIDQITIAF